MRMMTRPACLTTLCLVLGISAAHGQVPTPPAPAAAPASARVTPAQAQSVLDVLQDDKRRAEFTATLETMTKALPVAATLPLEPDSLGEQLLSHAAEAVNEASTQVAATLRTVNDLPLLWRWLASQADDPDARARVLDAGWRLLLVLLAAGGAEWLAARVLAGLRRVLGAWAPGDADRTLESDPLVEPVSPDEKAAIKVRRRSLLRVVAALRRLPYLVGRLMLDLAPIAVFAGVSSALLATPLGATVQARAAVLVVVRAYVILRAVLAVTAMLASPEGAPMRLLHISDHAAHFITRWTRRLAVIFAVGWVLAEIGLVFGMYRTAHDAVLKLFGLAVHVCGVVMVLQSRDAVARRIRAGSGSGATGVWPVLRNRLAGIWHLVAIFYIIALWLVWAVELRQGYARLITFFLETSAVLATGRLVSVLLLGALDRMRPLSDSRTASVPLSAAESRAEFYFPVMRALITALVMAASGFALLEVWGFGAWSWLNQTGLGARIVSAAASIGVMVVLAVVVWEGTNAAAMRHITALTQGAHLARAGRLRTLLPMLRTTLMLTIVLVVGLMTLSEIGVNIAPLLAGAGVVGIAVGFGSQKLVQDLITGLFLLMENAMQVGDVVTLGGLTGTVEALSIRTIRLRALDGSVHIIPFSAVTTVTNQTRDYGYAVLDISVGLNEEPAAVTEIVRTLAAEMRAEPRWGPLVLDTLDVMGVDRFIDTAYVLRVRMKTQPASRWSVGRELNRRIKVRFDELAIESPMTSYRVLQNAAVEPAAEVPT